MSTISGGLETLLANYRTLEREPIRVLESRKSNVDLRIGLFDKLKSQLKDLETITKDLTESGTTSLFGKKTATSSDEDFLTVSSSNSAIASSSTVFVEQLAKADKIISNRFTNGASTIVGGAGTQNFDITVNGVASTVSVTFEGTETDDEALQKVATAVNNTTDLNVSASIIKDTAVSSRLVFTSDDTGGDFEMTVSGGLLSTLGIDGDTKSVGTSGGYLYESTELNAKATIDGIAVESNTNTLEDVVSGLTIDLKRAQTVGDTPITINVENDVEGIKEKLQTFMDAYNGVVDYIKKNTATNTATYERSAFSGDYSISSFRFQMREILATPVTGLGVDEPTLLTELGFAVDRNGKLSIDDATELEDVIKNNVSQLDQIFSAEDGFASRFETLLDTMTGGDGIIEKRKTVLQSQITAINSRVKQMESSVDRKIDSYRDQFARLQAAIAQYQSQSSYISALTQSSFVNYG